MNFALLENVERLRSVMFWACLAAPLGAQEKSQQEGPPAETLETRLERLEKEFALEREVHAFEIDALHEQLGDLEGRGQRSQPANVFNPQITVFGNSTLRADNRKVYLDDDLAEGRLDDRFHFRELEVDFRGAIDPFADAVVILGVAAELPGEFELGLEEGYVELKRLPFVESAPLGLKLRMGRLRPVFGRLNQIHLHDLPQPSYPRALSTFLGPEGYVQDGLAARFFLPLAGEHHALEADLQWLSGGDLPIAEDQGGSNLAGAGRLKYFRELNQSSTLELGSSLWRSDSDHSLWGLDATYKWKPLLQGQSRSFLIGGELFRAELERPGVASSPGGYYLWTQYQFTRSLYLGLRFDQSETLADSSVDSSTLGLWGTYYTSEFLRMRLGFEETQSDLALLDGLRSVIFELNFIFGSHPTEPYWVNR